MSEEVLSAFFLAFDLLLLASVDTTVGGLDFLATGPDFMIKWVNKIGHSSRSSSIQRSTRRMCLVMLNNFEKFSFPSIEKRLTKDKETDR